MHMGQLTALPQIPIAGGKGTFLPQNPTTLGSSTLMPRPSGFAISVDPQNVVYGLAPMLTTRTLHNATLFPAGRFAIATDLSVYSCITCRALTEKASVIRYTGMRHYTLFLETKGDDCDTGRLYS